MSWRDFYFAWPSWITELLSGLCCAALGILLVPENAGYILLCATTISVVYELFLDQNPDGKPRDLLQRQAGILLGLALWIAR